MSLSQESGIGEQVIGLAIAVLMLPERLRDLRVFVVK